MIAFDPFTATFEEALAHPDPLNISRFGKAQELIICREHFAANPLDGIAICAQAGLLIPDWLAGAYLTKYGQVKRAEVGSWDEAFGLPHPKGQQLARTRHRLRVRMEIFRDIIDAIRLDPARPIDAALFDDVGRKHGAGKTLAEDLYREAAGIYGYSAAGMKRSLARTPANQRKLTGLRRKR